MRKLLFAILVIIPCVLFAQPQLTFWHLNRENGLSDNTIESILQDSHGFIWVGTSEGVSIYNGYQFRIFQKEQPVLNICDNYILNITEDSKKRIWVSTTNGVALYNEQFGIMHTKNQPIEEVSRSNFVSTVFEQKNGTILACTNYGINKYDETSGEFRRLKTPDIVKSGLDKERVRTIVKDHNNIYWVGTYGGGIYLLTEDLKIAGNLKKGHISSNEVSCMALDAGGNIWVGYADKGLDCISPQYKLLKHFEHSSFETQSISSNLIKCITRDHKGNLWIGTENGGLNILNPVTNKIDRYQNSITNLGGISQKTVAAIIEDRQHSMWIGTHRGGLDIYTPFLNMFRHYTQGIDNRSLSFKDVKSFYEAKDGQIYISTDGGGLNIWNRQTNTFSSYRSRDAGTGLLSDAILYSFEDSHGRIWVGTWQGGLNEFNPATGNFTSYTIDPSNPYSIKSNSVWKMVEDEDHKLWIATSAGGVNIFDPETKRFYTIDEYTGNGKGSIYGNNINDIIKDHAGNMWIAAQDGGLNRYNKNTGNIHHYFATIQDGQRHSYNINSVYCDMEGNIWAAPTEGLYKYNNATDSFVLFDKFKNIQTLKIRSIVDDNNGNLWCGTQYGIVKINKNGEGKLATYTPADGLQGTEFTRNACLKLRSGELLFGGPNGFNIFNPAEISVNNTPPQVYITDVFVLNKQIFPSAEKKSILKKQILNKGSMVLPYKQSALFSVEFAAINYIATEKNQYEYKLEGFDDKWNNIGSQRRVTFTNLDPGNYTLIIRAANNDGVWNMDGAVVDIEILPPFWKTWWFRTLVLLLVLGLLTFYFILYRNILARKLFEKKQEEVYNMKLDFFTHISHEFRTPLSLILGATEKLSADVAPKNASNVNVLSKNVNRLISLIKDLMDFRKVESGAVRLSVSEGSIQNFLLNISEDFIAIAEKKKIELDIDIPQNGQAVWFDKRVIEKIVLNLLNNGVKYNNEGGKLSIRLTSSINEAAPAPYGNVVSFQSKQKSSGNNFYIIVEDNGIGIPKESFPLIFEQYYRVPSNRMGSGIGLSLVKSLTLLHKGTLQLSSEKDKGTQIIIGIPKNKEDYKPDERSISEIDFHKSISMENLEKIDEQDDVPQYVQEQNEVPPKDSFILLVEDDTDLRKFLSTSLSEEFTVSTAANGLEGLQKVKELKPSLIISDIMMPEMDGIELCKRVKQDPELNHIPVILLTAREGMQSQMEGMASGADYYFTKPISISLLLIQIRNILVNKNRLKLHYLSDYQHEVKDNIHSSRDREFIDTLLMILENELDNPDLNVDFLCKKMCMSKNKLYTTLKRITGKSINEFIRTTRLKKAQFIMTNESVSISEVMMRVGISSASYFTNAFKKEFDKTPSEFYNDLKNKN